MFIPTVMYLYLQWVGQYCRQLIRRLWLKKPKKKVYLTPKTFSANHVRVCPWRFWKTVWSLIKLKMFPQKHDSYLSWRNSCKILKVPYPSSMKENSFSLFSPKFSCHKKRRIYWKGFTLSLLWSSISGLHLFRLTAQPGKARHEIHIRTALGSLFFCLFRQLSLSYCHLGALLICFYAHLAFISLDTPD